MYEHSGTGLKKASHERMLNDRGRKVIKEKAGTDHFNSYDHFKGMGAARADDFDRDWNDMAARMGFQPNTMALEYGAGDPFGNN